MSLLRDPCIYFEWRKRMVKIGTLAALTPLTVKWGKGNICCIEGNKRYVHTFSCVLCLLLSAN